MENIDALAEQLAARTDAFECFHVQRRTQSVAFQAGELKTAQTTDRRGVGLRVVAGGKLATGGTSDPAAVAQTVDATIEAADFGDPYDFELARPADAPADDLRLFDPRVAELQVADLVALGRRAVDRLADLAAVATLGVEVEAERVAQSFVNSAGQRFEFQQTHLGVSVSLEFFGQDDIFSVWDYHEACDAEVDVERLTDAVRRKFEQAREVVPAGPARQAIVFSPHGLRALLTPLLAGLNGRNVADGVSPLADKRGGDRLLDAKFTLTDDGTLPGRPGTSPFDDEGVPTRKTVLLDAGRVAEFLLDLQSAARVGLASTGNASRPLAGSPSPGTTNLLLQPGQVSLDAMLADVSDGVLVESLLGVGQGNVVGGDYANPIGLAYKIRDGRIVGRVKNVSIAGNVYTDLREVTAVEDRGHWRGSSCLPHVRLDTIALATG